MQVKVEGISFFNWLITKYFPKNKTSISFITFLFVKNGLFVNENYTYSDYLIANLLSDCINKPEYFENEWIVIQVLYLLQIKNFNKKANMLISQEKP